VNLPVEFDASNRAKQILTDYQIVDEEGRSPCRVSCRRLDLRGRNAADAAYNPLLPLPDFRGSNRN
jgi:hypothetical protein